MNLQAIILLNGFGAALLIMLIINRDLTRRTRRLEDKIYSVMLWLAFWGCIAEPATFCADRQPGLMNRIINIAGNVYLYSAEVCLLLLWVYYVDLRLYRDRDRLRPVYKKWNLISSGMLLLLVINLFTGFVFSVDETNTYHREWGCYIFYIYFAILLIISLKVYFSYLSNYGSVKFFQLWMFLIPILAAGLVQAAVYGISVIWPGVALGLTFVYLNLQSRQAFLDSLTGLYNRQFIEHTMLIMQTDAGAGYYGILLDIDYFKHINDNFGHSVGDDALCDAANIFRRAVMRDATPFRYAGDEFIIIMKTNDESDILHMEDRIRGEMHRFNENTTKPYKLSFSMGHARFDPSDTEDSFLKKMDEGMYNDKQKNHERLDSEFQRQA